MAPRSRKPLDRRTFLGGAATVTGALMTGCLSDPPEPNPQDAGRSDGGQLVADTGTNADTGTGADTGQMPTDAGGETDAGQPDAGNPEMCGDPFAGGTMLGLAAFSGEGNSTFHQIRNQGWDGRLLTDLREVDNDNLIIPNENFFVRTRYPDLLDRNAPWRIAVSGLVNSPVDITLDDLTPNVRSQGAHVLECSGNGAGGGFGLLSAAEWSGVPLTEVLAGLDIQAAATRVLVSGFDMHSVPSAGGHSTPGASWVFSFEQLEQTGAFLATQMNGVTLPDNHGYPVRLYVPRWYGCSNIKWVNEIRLVDDSEPSTSQMREFASRTHQVGVPGLARNFRPAEMHQAAMPTRIEKWNVDGEIRYRVVGILWGGFEVTDALEIRFGGGDWTPVDVCPDMITNQTWTVWSHSWTPPQTGTYSIRMRIDDNSIPTQRLDVDFYLRNVFINEV